MSLIRMEMIIFYKIIGGSDAPHLHAFGGPVLRGEGGDVVYQAQVLDQVLDIISTGTSGQPSTSCRGGGLT